MSIAKVLGIGNDKVFLGFEDGNYKELEISTFTFTPVVGDEVRIDYINGGVKVSKYPEVKEEVDNSNCNRGKILLIEKGKVLIGLENGIIEEITNYNLNFTPQIEDKVELFRTSTSVLIGKLESEVETNSTTNNYNSNNYNNTSSYSYNGYNTDNSSYYNPNHGYQNNYSRSNNEMMSDKVIVNKTNYALLVFFVGGLGGHKFYIGDTTKGILFLLFWMTGIPSILALIEFVRVLSRESDAYGNILVK